MADVASPPFGRGETYFAPNVTPDSTSGAHLEGREYWFEDASGDLGRRVLCRIVRNASGISLIPKRLVTFTSGKRGSVDGYADVNSEQCCPVDDAYASSVRSNDLFYVIVEGPALIKTSLAGDATNVIAVGDFLQNATAATSGATTAGRARLALLDGATAVLAGQIRNIIGRALSAKTTANTGESASSDVLVDVNRW